MKYMDEYESAHSMKCSVIDQKFCEGRMDGAYRYKLVFEICLMQFEILFSVGVAL
jgi:hypothetical protein